ncbi:MAG: c-type cytochrome [Cyclobacteriaceae bacterium]|nr:c-type cytochrome [Cyclobacteriaceae bacterium]
MRYRFFINTTPMKAIKLLSLFCMLLFAACDPFESAKQREIILDLPEIPFSYNVSGTSDHLPTLGRVLFYDPRLSINNSVSCASCHKQTLAFSDDAAFSRGFENRITSRNSMPIQNIISNLFAGIAIDHNLLIDSMATDSVKIDVNDPTVGAYLPGVFVSPDFFVQPTKLFWDGRENDLAIMVTRPIMNHIEMGISDLDILAMKLSSIKEYNTLFINAFGNGEITKEKISTGLSAFLLSIRSNQSKFDKSLNLAINNSFNINDGSSQLSAIEELGRQLFFDKFNCNSCHESNGFADIGLDANPKDLGMSSITGNTTQAGMFKIPSLRNVQLTGPYMHDGRFKTLEEVLQHYSHGISNSKNLDDRLRVNGKAKQMNMTDAEVKAIVSFLNTLTDYEMITDPKLSNPFKVK